MFSFISRTAYVPVLIFMLLFALPANCNADTKPTMKIYYITFNAETYGDITYEELEKNPRYQIHFYQHHPFINEVKDAFAHSSTNNQKVRLKNLRLIVKMGENEDAVYAVNMDGTALEVKSGKTFQLNEKYKIVLGEKIVNFHRVVDQLPTMDVWGTD